MTVSELIEALKEMPQGNKVHLDAHFVAAESGLCSCSIAVPVKNFYCFDGQVFISGEYEMGYTVGE